MKYLLDQDDEQKVLDELVHSQRKAELIRQSCINQGKPHQAASWAKSVQRIEERIMLLAEVFKRKN